MLLPQRKRNVYEIIYNIELNEVRGLGERTPTSLKWQILIILKSLRVSSEFEQNDEWHDNPLFIESQFVTYNILSSKQIDPNSSLMLTRKRSLMNLTYSLNKTKYFIYLECWSIDERESSEKIFETWDKSIKIALYNKDRHCNSLSSWRSHKWNGLLISCPI